MGRAVKSVGDDFEFNRELYADDACFLSASRAELQLDLVHTFDGLTAVEDAGWERARAKTEAMFIPASGTESDYGAANLSDLSGDGGPVSYSNKTSRYLGSIILEPGRPDVDSRIRAAAKAFCALRDCVFTRREVPLRTTATVYTAVVLNLLLHGCESWALTSVMRRRLTFHNRCVRCRVTAWMQRVHNSTRFDL